MVPATGRQNSPRRSHVASNPWAAVLLLSLLTISPPEVQGQYRAPTLVEHPSDHVVGRDGPATLNCHAVGHPPPSIVWYKNGLPLPTVAGSRHVVLDSGDLFFLQVVQDDVTDDTGTYWCVASNTVGSVRSKNATLEIAVLEEEFEQGPRNTRVAEGEAAMLECRPPRGSPPPVVTWSKDGRQLDPAVNHRYRVSQSGELVITRARVGDSGRYTCTARNAYATRTAPPATLSVLVKPHLVSTSGVVTSPSGGTVELVCRVGGDPPPEVFWGRVSPPGAQLPLERLVQEERGQVLRLRHVSAEDRGVYSCTAENPVGLVAANTTLNVHSRPVFTTKPKNSRVGVDGTARFSCVITGSPSPTTYWTHEGSGFIVSMGQTWSGGRISVGGDNTLNIVGVRQTDTGYYACVGVGEAGSAIARAYLEVQGVSDMPPPIIAIGSTNQTLPLGTEAELPCEAKGTPEPEVSWSFGGETIDVLHSNRHNITPLGTLRIWDLELSDSGQYTCTASSIAGSSMWRATLAVHKATNPNIRFNKMFWDSDLPEPPQNLMVLVINTTQVTLGWSRGRSGSSSVRSHTVQYWSPDLRGQWREAATITPPYHTATPLATTVTNLSANTRYVFTVRSRNKEWLSRPAAFTHVIRTTGGPNHVGVEGDTSIPLRDVRNKLTSASVRLVTVEAISSTSLKVTWRVLIDINTLEGIYVRYRPLDSNTDLPVGALSVETIHFPLVGDRSTPISSINHVRMDQLNNHHLSGVPTSHIISNLRPASGYEVFVVPFYRSIEGQPTSSMRRTTLPAPAQVTPSGLHYRIINQTVIRVGWDPLPPTLDVGGSLRGYNLQVVDTSRAHPLVQNSTTNATFVFVPNLKIGVTYEIFVRGVTNLGLGPASEALRFSPAQENITKTISNNSIPSSTSTSNTYMIIAIVCSGIIVSSIIFGVMIYIYRKRHLSKCPHYFSKGDCSSGPWSAYSGCWEDGTNTAGISTTRYTDGTVSAMNNTRYTDGTLTGLSNMRYTDSGVRGNAPMINAALYTDAGGQFYAAANDSKSVYDVRPADDMMYEDPDGLRLVSFKGRHNGQRCASPEPYATTPLITIGTDPAYPRSVRGGKSAGGLRLPPNIPHIAPLEAAHNFNTHSDKGSLSSGPVLQFPPPPPPPAISGGEGGNSTTASSNSRGDNSNSSRGPQSRGGGSSQHLFLQHLPYHPTGGSNSSHHTSPLLHPRTATRTQISPNPSADPSHINLSHHNNSHMNNPISPNYSQCLEPSNPFLHAKNAIHAAKAAPNRPVLESWLSNGVALGSTENGFVGGEYPPNRCHSPQSSAMGDAEESDDKEGDESCWSGESRGTNDNEISSNGSASGSISSLNPDLNWTEAIKLMSENRWPNDSPNSNVDQLPSVASGFNQFSNIKDHNVGVIKENPASSRNDDKELQRRLLGQPEQGAAYTGLDDSGSESGTSRSAYYCQIPVDTKNTKQSQLSDRPLPVSKSSHKSIGSSSGARNHTDGHKSRKHSSHSRKTSLTSPLV